MIINSNSVSLTEASEILGIPEHEVLRLSQYGYLEHSKTLNGKTRIALHSLEKYARRSKITLQYPKSSIHRFDSCSIQEAMKKLGLTNEKELHKLIQAGRLKAYFKGEEYVINTQSLHDFVTGRC